MAKKSIQEQIEELHARWELASRINQVFYGGWPEGRDYVHLPHRIRPALEESQILAGGSFYLERGGELTFVPRDEMDRHTRSDDREALRSLIESYRESGESVTQLEALHPVRAPRAAVVG